MRLDSKCVALAALSCGAGVIHLVMVPSHIGESAVEGVGFAVAGWLQLGLGALFLSRAWRSALVPTMVVNVVLIGLWALSRSVGLPSGPQPWHAEVASSVDVICVGLEVALVLASGLVLVRPEWPRRATAWRVGLAAGVPLAVVALTTGALASPSARDHAAHSHGAHDDRDTHVASGGHAHGGRVGHDTASDDRGLSKLGNGHEHGGEEVALDPPTQAALTAQLAGTYELMARYPTLAAARAAGYTRAGPFVPGLGTHYIDREETAINSDGRMDPGDLRRPVLIYDGLGEDAPLAGFMYEIWSDGPPDGFVGPNDSWHRHTNTCVVYRDDSVENPFGFDFEVTESQCERVGGNFVESTGYMVHVWTVPGYESSQGVFSEINPRIDCPDGTYYTKPIEDLGFSPSLCRS